MKLIKVNCPVGFKIPVRARPDIHSEALKFLRTGDEFYIVSESIGFYILSENQVLKALRGINSNLVFNDLLISFRDMSIKQRGELIGWKNRKKTPGALHHRWRLY